jgi:DNA modification methylase
MLLTGDNLTLLRERVASGSVDLIYADPPFNSGHDYFSTQAGGSGAKRGAGARASFGDVWRWDEAVFERAQAECAGRVADALRAMRLAGADGPDLAYAAFLAPRIGEFARVLKASGSVYLHVDVKMSHWVRVLLDAQFGRAQFRNEIAWAYRTGGAGKKQFSRKHDAILFYSASKKYTFHPQYERVRYAKAFFSAQRDAEGFYADVLMRDVWEIPAVINVSKDRTGYPTQKPLALLERIVLSSSNPGDCVLDPFCGSGTTLLAAQRHGRRWIGIDVNAEAVAVAQERVGEQKSS